MITDPSGHLGLNRPGVVAAVWVLAMGIAIVLAVMAAAAGGGYNVFAAQSVFLLSRSVRAP